ncbi:MULTISPECIES: DUF2165 family protein [Oleiagrimonas]|uniref:DUF2165 domain-containing protein n=1 Tax=Oleiagrimonas citrea TaxID=1665687 RepID=A0A846ZPB9_9GAMM|nr:MULTISPECIES: DUF2165 family protein [Oleiagrimonas]NKZ39886.1 DUF2165 domain-containing protein [Oleiagrimonas citrea]RAP56928.1 hypothetical protein BTJ49_12380 [Oleiagrimonas sp. MCCC 1A03011]
MAIRYLKLVLVAFVGLQGWLYVAGNLANWHAGVGAISYVIGMQDHAIYPHHIAPVLSGPMWASLVFVLILCGEFLVGALSLKGAWDLWAARGQPAIGFNSAKKYAVLGPGMAMVVWFGGFIVLGGAWFQMWQTQIGDGSFKDAFVYAVTAGLILLFVQHADD